MFCIALCTAVNPVLFFYTILYNGEKPTQGPTMNMLPSIDSKPENLSGPPGFAKLPTGVPSGIKMTLGPNILPSGEFAVSSKGIPTSAITSGAFFRVPFMESLLTPTYSPTVAPSTSVIASTDPPPVPAPTGPETCTFTPDNLQTHILVEFKGAPEGLTDQDFRKVEDVPAAASIMIPTERRHRQQTISRNSSSHHDSNFDNPTNDTTNSSSISTPNTSKQQHQQHRQTMPKSNSSSNNNNNNGTEKDNAKTKKCAEQHYIGGVIAADQLGSNSKM
jgi:hypothetical protein